MLLYLSFIFGIFGLALFLAASWLFHLVSLCMSKARKSPETARSSGVILAWLSGFIVVLGGFVYLLFFPPAMLVYRQEFGESPSVDVTDLRASSSFGHDGNEAFLRFQATPQTVQHLATLRHLTLMGAGDSKFSELGQTPVWWNPQPDATFVIYGSQTQKNYGATTITLIYAPNSRLVFYGFSRVD